MNVRLQQINRNLLDLLIGVGTHLCNSKIRFQGPEIIPTKHQSLLVQMTRDQISSNSHSFNFKNRVHKINLHLIFRHRTNRYNQLILKGALFQDQSELSYQPDHIQILTQALKLIIRGILEQISKFRLSKLLLKLTLKLPDQKESKGIQYTVEVLVKLIQMSKINLLFKFLLKKSKKIGSNTQD